MTTERRLSQRTTMVGAGAVALVLTVGALAAPAQARIPVGSQAVPDPCPAPVPMSSVSTGMTGQGYTVVTGTTPQPFNVKVLGVLTNGIGAGRDLIAVEVSDVAGGHVIDQGGGIWQGMSGSPVYVNGQLLGAVSYGFTGSPSPIGGVTPAADMVKLLNLPQPAVAKGEPVRDKSKVTLSAGVRRQLAAQADAAVPAGSLSKLPLPLSVSGLNSRRMKSFQADLDAAGLSLVAHTGGARTLPAGQVPTATPVAGGNFAATLAYGDLTAAAIGTTTAVCGSQALAFGHPFYQSGPVSYGASNADSLAIVKDTTFGAFKLATMTDPVGTVDQDRSTGVRVDLTTLPFATTITSTIANSGTGVRRTGTSQIVDQTVVAEGTLYAILANYDNVFDEYGDGRATSHWTITGTRAGGVPFSVHRDNRWADRFDPTEGPAFEAAGAVDALLSNEDEPVTVDSVTFSSTVNTTFTQLTLTKLEVAVNGGRYSSPDLVTVKAGDKLHVRLSLRPYLSATTKKVTTTLTVPKSARGSVIALEAVGGLDAAGGGDAEKAAGQLLDGQPTGNSLDATIADILSIPQNDDLRVSLLTPGDDETAPTTLVTKNRRQKSVVAGARSIAVAVRR